MTIEELLQKIEEGDQRVIGSLIMFSAQIPGSRGFWKLEMKKLLALQNFVDHFSGGEERINVFMTFSLPDFHMDELHRQLPGHEQYLDKTVIKRWEDLPQGANREDYILKDDDYKLRRDALQNHGHIVNEFASLRMKELMETVLTPVLGITEHAIRIEFQNRTAVHFHMLGKCETNVTEEEFSAAMKKYLYVEDLEETGEELDKTIKEQKRQGVVIVEPGEKDNVKPVVDEARQKTGRFCTFQFGQSIMHPQVNQDLWPENNAPPPSINVLRHPFPGHPEVDEERDYEYLVNRVQRHKCTRNYCLKILSNGHEFCRFGYPKYISAGTSGWGHYEVPGTDPGTTENIWGRVPDTFPEGYQFNDFAGVEQCWLVGNHPFMVSHVPEILRVWRGKGIDCIVLLTFASFQC